MFTKPYIFLVKNKGLTLDCEVATMGLESILRGDKIILRYISSLGAAFVFAAMVVISLAPSAKSGTLPPPTPTVDDCLEFCQDNAVCMCVKVLGGSLRLTKCNIGAQCVDGSCDCQVDPICKPFIERDLEVKAFPPGDPVEPCPIPKPTPTPDPTTPTPTSTPTPTEAPACAHSPCEEGGNLVVGCDNDPGVTCLCVSVDPNCCFNAGIGWDFLCVNKYQINCGGSCPQ